MSASYNVNISSTLFHDYKYKKWRHFDVQYFEKIIYYHRFVGTYLNITFSMSILICESFILSIPFMNANKWDIYIITGTLIYIALISASVLVPPDVRRAIRAVITFRFLGLSIGCFAMYQIKILVIPLSDRVYLAQTFKESAK